MKVLDTFVENPDKQQWLLSRKRSNLGFLTETAGLSWTGWTFGSGQLWF